MHLIIIRIGSDITNNFKFSKSGGMLLAPDRMQNLIKIQNLSKPPLLTPKTFIISTSF